MSQTPSQSDDELGIEIEVLVMNGEVFAVQVNGEQVRARVMDYDVTFPCVAQSIKMDADGDYYKELIV